LGALDGELLSAFGDGAVLSDFEGVALSLLDGAALSDFCGGLSFLLPCASAWPAPNTSARAATELNSEFFISISCMTEPMIGSLSSKEESPGKGSRLET
jgi:hypothetical protein